MLNYSAIRFLFVLFVVILFSCSATDLQSSEIHIPPDYEIEDVRILDQDIRAYTTSYSNDSLGKACQGSLLSDFKRKYYSPWTRNLPLPVIAESKGIMEKYLLKEWYGENKRKVPKSNIEEI